MQGFKSFADPVNIEFNEGVTCIIGPNGSGKSNISDALRWVLGEQSSKQLRGSKMQDVIFAGTATRKPKGMAEVTLVIDNSNNILPLEYNEVAVTRRMFRSGESEYLINGNQCRLRDIRELFMDTGIGVEGYSIIGQGKIADIVSTRPENRRQIFEEAAGVVLYKSRKSEAENKLKAATVDLDRVRDIIAEIEGRIDGLKEDSEKATEYIGLRDRYKTLGINIILHNLSNLEIGDILMVIAPLTEGASPKYQYYIFLGNGKFCWLNPNTKNWPNNCCIYDYNQDSSFIEGLFKSTVTYFTLIRPTLGYSNIVTGAAD